MKKEITVTAPINASIYMVWNNFTIPADIMRWNNANGNWHTTCAENDLRENGRFNYRMEPKNKFGLS